MKLILNLVFTFLGVLAHADAKLTVNPVSQDAYKTGHELLEIYENSGVYGFVSVPLDYNQPNGPKMDVFYHLPKPIDPNKRTILFFPGGPGGSTVQSDYEDGLSEFNLIYVDPRGTGFSKPERESEYQIPQYFTSDFIARDAKTVLDTLQVSAVTVYGHSYGTLTATKFANYYPTVTKAVVLEGTVFSGQAEFWSSSVLRKLLQKYFDQLSLEKQNKILVLSRSGNVAPGWFSIMARSAMYNPDFQSALTKKLNELFALNEEKLLAQINNELGYRIQVGRDTPQFSGRLYLYLTCQDLSANNPRATLGFVFQGKTLVPDTSDRIADCQSVPGLESMSMHAYDARKFPLKMPVTYFQGTWDGATPVDGAIHHYQNVAKGFSQLVLVRKSGHWPLIMCLKKEASEGSQCPERSKLLPVIRQAFSGLPISQTSLNNLDPEKNWVLTSKGLH